MENTLEPPILNEPSSSVVSVKNDRSLFYGYLLLTASFLFFVLVEYINPSGTKKDFFSIFLVHYICAIAYAVILIYHKSFGMRRSWRKENIHKTTTLLLLFYVSAFALNRELTVFQDSTGWLSVYILVISIALISMAWFRKLPVTLNHIQLFVLGSALLFFLYQSLFGGEIYLFGFLGLILFGIGGHIFVPLFLMIATLVAIRHAIKENGSSTVPLFSGAITTLVILTLFTLTWTKRMDNIERLSRQSVLYPSADLPAWVKIAQSVPNDWVTERILKTDRVYTTPPDRFGNGDFFGSRSLWDEEKKHDPLVFVASFFKSLSIAWDERVKIIKVLSDGRHRAEERLWSGDNLTTSYIVTDIDLYPSLRLAYTEKYLDIRNNAGQRRWWGDQEEAIYTFQLPEGSVVTSLSLWINGHEEKGILTSKQKATTAYKTIVGVEVRDPSVVHWQEGNTVTVRVFPCTTDEERKFKIGITSPLVVKENVLVYPQIRFHGPSPDGSNETVRVSFPHGDYNGTIDGFAPDAKGHLVREGKFDPDFQIAIAAPSLRKDNHFFFDGFEYSITQMDAEYAPFDPDQIYLDLNNSWTPKELDALKSIIGNKEVWVYGDDNFVRITDANWHVTSDFRKRNFSLFPFHLIDHADSAIVLTKGRPLSPHLADLGESNFRKGVADFFSSGRKAYVYGIGETSTYIKSLREFRAIHFAGGDLPALGELFRKKVFPVASENSDKVVLHDARLSISRRLSAPTKNNAPDHLARLFAYNNVMRKVGADFFKSDYVREDLVAEASKAYVVSPVSSLIVLESKHDYERFGINDTENSLKNAAKDSAGAVPEPHEWALIILFLMLVLFLRWKRSHTISVR